MRARSTHRQRIRSAGFVHLVTLVVVAALVFVGASMVAMANRNMLASRHSADTYAALSLAELGLRRAANILRVAPVWGLSPGTRTLQQEVASGEFKGSYLVHVTNTGLQASGGYPIIEMVATGSVGSRTHTVSATVHVEPPAFLNAALALYQHQNGQGNLVTDGDLYVTGAFQHTGRLCVQGNLIADTITLNGGGPSQGLPAACTGSNHVITGTTSADLAAHPEAFRDRPLNPASWYRWAQSLVWQELYGKPAPATGGLTFAQVLDGAASANHPYGVVYFVDGDFTIPDSSPPGQGHLFSGRATIVVNGTLHVAANRIAYAGADSHLALVSLGGIRFSPEANGPFSALFYTYDDGEVPHAPNAGRVYSQTPGGPVSPIGTLAITGTLAAAYLNQGNGSIAVAAGDMPWATGPAPAIPGMRVVVDRWQVGEPDDEKLKQRWGIN